MLCWIPKLVDAYDDIWHVFIFKAYYNDMCQLTHLLVYINIENALIN